MFSVDYRIALDEDPLDYDGAAKWCARRGLVGAIGDPLPASICDGVYVRIASNRAAFMERVRDFAHLRRIPQAWQREAERVKTERVQYWARGVMVTGMMSRENAQKAVREGRAFVMTEQAVGALNDGMMDS